jgi:hypothetical protein
MCIGGKASESRHSNARQPNSNQCHAQKRPDYVVATLGEEDWGEYIFAISIGYGSF